MKSIIFTGTHRKHFADRVLGIHFEDTSDFSYYSYDMHDEQKFMDGFGYWTLNLEDVLENHKHLGYSVITEEINQSEYQRIETLISMGLTLEDAFKSVFKME